MYKIEDFKRLIIVTDNYNHSKSDTSMFSRDINRATSKNVDLLKVGFEKLFEEVIIYDDQSLFLENIKEHKNDIIFPYWYGHTSRNRQALIASLCEIENLIYVGPDAYSNIVCCDKILSKDICRLNGVKFPKFKVIRSLHDKIEWSHNFPVIIKPSYEGSSMGISQDSVQYDIEGVKEQVLLIMDKFNQPVIIEQFIPGKEVSVAIIGWGENIKVWSATERIHTSDPNFFQEKVFSYDEKRLKDNIIKEDARHKINSKTLNGLFKLFKWLDKVEYLRIDGKIINGKFWCIELTNDMSMSPEGSFFNQLKYVGLNFNESLELLINNCLERYNNQPPNQL